MPLNIDWQQILLHLFNFVILFAILYLLLYKPVKQFMDERTKYYEKLDNEAKENLAASEKLQLEHTEKLNAIEIEIAEKKENAHKELEASLALRKKQADEEASKIITDARKSAQYEREKMLKEAKNEITEIVTNATEKIVSKGSTSDAFDQFLSVAQRGGNDE